MHKYIWVGLDVHKVTIAVAVAKGEEVPHSLGTIPNDPDAIAKLMRKLGPSARLRVCYEAGPCGYVLYRQLTAMGIDCAVVAPTLCRCVPAIASRPTAGMPSSSPACCAAGSSRRSRSPTR